MTGAQFAVENVAGVTTYRVTPTTIDPRWAGTVFVHVHGGAFVFNGGEAAMSEAIWMAHVLGVEVVSVDYRRPPLHAFPAATDDVIAVWRQVIQDHDPAKVAMFGTSAGGNLTLSTVLQLRDMGAPLPGAIMAGTPAVDLAQTSDSWNTLQGLDPLGAREGVIEGTFDIYADGTDLTDPRLSPIYANLDELPPTVLLTGTRDLLLSDTVRMHRALRAAGVAADLHVYDGQSHGDYMAGFFVNAPETHDAWRELNTFFDQHPASGVTRHDCFCKTPASAVWPSGNTNRPRRAHERLHQYACSGGLYRTDRAQPERAGGQFGARHPDGGAFQTGRHR